MSEDTKTQLERFSDDLDALIERWLEKPEDDRLNVAELAGVLNFKAFSIMADARDRVKELE